MKSFQSFLCLNSNELFKPSSVINFIKELEDFLENDKSIYYSIDRFEGNFAICENRKTLKMESIPISRLPKNITKNSILKYVNNNFFVDELQTSIAKENIHYKSKKVYKK